MMIVGIIWFVPLIQIFSLGLFNFLKMMENWIQQWEEIFGVGPGLRNFFSGSQGQDLVKDLQEYRADPRVLGFCLIFFIWGDKAWANTMPQDEVRQRVKHLKNATIDLQRLGEAGLIGPHEEVVETREKLRRWAMDNRGLPSVKVGKVLIAGNPPPPKRHRGKRQVVFFLTGYFRSLACKRPPWKIITKFLIHSHLVEPSTKPKIVATWWANVLNREVKGKEPIEPYQDSLIKWFEDEKESVEMSRSNHLISPKRKT